MNHAAADRFVLEHMQEPFDWSSNNCVTFSTGFVHALHGYDLLGAAGRPENLREAIREVRSNGSLQEAVTRRLGNPVPAAMAGYGDLVLVSGTEGVGDSLAVCVGATVLAPGEGGVARLPLSQASIAWKTAPSPS